MKKQKKARISRGDIEKEMALLSVERTILSKERTMLAEITVLISLMAFGFVLIRLFMDTPVSGFTAWIGAAFVLIGTGGSVWALLAFKKYSIQLKRVEKKDSLRI